MGSEGTLKVTLAFDRLLIVSQVAWKLGIDVAWPNQFNRVRFPKL